MPDDYPGLEPLDRLELKTVREMAAWLGARPGMRLLDAGCGAGLPALVFAEAGAEVSAIDVDAARLEAAETLLAGTPLRARVTFRLGDVMGLPAADASFDVVWCSYVLHHLADKEAAVREFKRVLRPGGRLAVREGGLPVQLLPFDLGLGEPGLQDRLRVADNRWFAAMTRATLPNEVPYPYGWARLLRDAGLSVAARTFVLEALQPFEEAQAAFVLHGLERTLARDRGEYGPLLNAGDRAVVTALVDDEDPRFILRRDDLHLRYGLSLYVGQAGDPRQTLQGEPPQP